MQNADVQMLTVVLAGSFEVERLVALKLLNEEPVGTPAKNNAVTSPNIKAGTVLEIRFI